MGLSSNSPVVLTVVTAGASYSRSFSIKVTQIECDSLSKAANGCLQYYQVPYFLQRIVTKTTARASPGQCSHSTITEAAGFSSPTPTTACLFPFYTSSFQSSTTPPGVSAWSATSAGSSTRLATTRSTRALSHSLCRAAATRAVR